MSAFLHFVLEALAVLSFIGLVLGFYLTRNVRHGRHEIQRSRVGNGLLVHNVPPYNRR